MSAGNAFAQAQTHANRQGQELQRVNKSRKQDDGVRPQALQRGDVLMLRTGNEDTVLEVDLLILDFLIYQVDTVYLQSRDIGRGSGSSSSRQAEGDGMETGETELSLKSNIEMLHWFDLFFRAKHPTYRPDRALLLRSDLLRVTALFIQRWSRNATSLSQGDLRRIRQDNQDRARRWIGSVERVPSRPWESVAEMYEQQLPLPQLVLERNRAHVLHSLDLPAEDEADEDAFYGTADCVSLLDILPLFIEVSATQNATCASDAKPRWLELAAQFMLQACLEQYLVFGASGTDVVDEAFAWGFKDEDHNDDHGDNETTHEHHLQPPSARVNDMFVDPENAVESPVWQKHKSEALAQLFPLSASQPTPSAPPNSYQPPSSPLPRVLEDVAAQKSLRDFEALVCTFLRDLHHSTELPVLLQVQRGQLTGMSRAETDAFLRGCGVLGREL